MLGFILVGRIIIQRLRRREQTDDVLYDRRTSASTETTPERPKPVTQDFGTQLRELDWFQFEKIVELIYRKRGYAVTRGGGAHPDDGIDLVIEKDGIRKAIQCKQWKTWNVGVKPVREFLGALTDSGIGSGIFVTLGGYTGDAKALAEKHGIEMLNEAHLVQMFEAVDGRYDPEIQSFLNDKRKLCPKCGLEMVLRTAGRGKSLGSQFWGCSGYPECRYTMQI